MGIRSSIATYAIRKARGLGRSLGCELVVEVSDHSIDLAMQQPDKEERAWDPELYKNGQLYYSDYANPIKPKIEYNQDLEQPDRVAATDGGDSDDAAHVKMISSPRYREYMRQDAISQILNPREQWRLIFFAVIGLALLVVVNIMMNASATGLI